MRNLDRIISETIHREINKLIREAEDGGDKKINAIKNEIVNKFAYSPIKNIPHLIPEYSVAYPATNSASCSSKSNGVLFVSANPAIVNKINAKG